MEHSSVTLTIQIYLLNYIIKTEPCDFAIKTYGCQHGRYRRDDVFPILTKKLGKHDL